MFRKGLLAAFAAIGLTAGAAAGQDSASFSVSIAGINAGTLAIEGNESGGSYEARGSIRTSGLVGTFYEGRLDAAANGRVSGNDYRPATYNEVTLEDGEKITRSIRYSGGVPSVTRNPPRKKPRKHAVSPAQQGGTVDPMTATYAILRDRDGATACGLDIRVFDGSTRARIRLNEATQTNGGLTCTGSYTREAGFDPDDMAKRSVWPLSMTYSGNPDRYRVQDIRLSTSLGTVRIRRR